MRLEMVKTSSIVIRIICLYNKKCECSRRQRSSPDQAWELPRGSGCHLSGRRPLHHPDHAEQEGHLRPGHAAAHPHVHGLWLHGQTGGLAFLLGEKAQILTIYWFVLSETVWWLTSSHFSGFPLNLSAVRAAAVVHPASFRHQRGSESLPRHGWVDIGIWLISMLILFSCWNYSSLVLLVIFV